MVVVCNISHAYALGHTTRNCPMACRANFFVHFAVAQCMVLCSEANSRAAGLGCPYAAIDLHIDLGSNSVLFFSSMQCVL